MLIGIRGSVELMQSERLCGQDAVLLSEYQCDNAGTEIGGRLKQNKFKASIHPLYMQGFKDWVTFKVLPSPCGESLETS